MVKLLISKIDNINVVQVDSSIISIQHKKAKSSKPASKEGNPLADEKGGSNNTVDLGAGEKKFKTKIYSFDTNDTNALFEILYNKRNCVVQDKFFGKIKAYVNGLSVENSDKHLGITIFDIDISIQEIEKKPVENVASKLNSQIEFLELELYDNAIDFAKEVDNIMEDNIFEKLSKFIDEALQLVSDTLNDLIGYISGPLKTMSSIQNGINTKLRLTDSLKILKEMPNDFANLLKDLTNFKTSTKFPVLTPIANLENKSQIEREQEEKNNSAKKLVNLTVGISELKEILNDEFISKQALDKKISDCIERLGNTDIKQESLTEIRYLTKAIAMQKDTKNIKVITIKDYTPLTNIVYSLYGNLEHLENIKKINNLSEYDEIIGTLKVYEDENSN